jgi:ProP effector
MSSETPTPAPAPGCLADAPTADAAPVDSPVTDSAAVPAAAESAALPSEPETTPESTAVVELDVEPLAAPPADVAPGEPVAASTDTVATEDGAVAAAAAPAPAPVRVDLEACTAELRQRFPALFAGPPKPIKLRIQTDIQERAPGVFTRQALSAFLRRHTGSTSYLIALGKATHRLDLDGQPAGEISAEHHEAAAQELLRRRELRREREQAMRQAQRPARGPAGRTAHGLRPRATVLPTDAAADASAPAQRPPRPPRPSNARRGRRMTAETRSRKPRGAAAAAPATAARPPQAPRTDLQTAPGCPAAARRPSRRVRRRRRRPGTARTHDAAARLRQQPADQGQLLRPERPDGRAPGCAAGAGAQGGRGLGRRSPAARTRTRSRHRTAVSTAGPTTARQGTGTARGPRTPA